MNNLGTDRPPIPVVLFAHARPHTLERTLACLRGERVPRIIAFSDGPRTADQAPAVTQVRAMLRAIDWCEVELHERKENLGLGRSILSGVTEALSRHPAVLVFEDDLICVPGTYHYLCEAMNAYWDHPCVLSVTGWTHPRVTPSDIGDRPYFDGRAECWVWGTWTRGWHDMNRPALELVRACRERGIDPERYGHDLLDMADGELKRNIWAVRFLYAHIVESGLCFRPPHSLVEHIGWGSEATNAPVDTGWSNPPLQPCPRLPEAWPDPVEHPECARLWTLSYPAPPRPSPWWRRWAGKLQRVFVRSPSANASKK
ncbi:MAG: hypothetical protein ACHQQS_00385 [Thermoanaerobaculales bacterium]